LIQILSNIQLNSFINHIFISLCVFSITFDASATFIFGALCVHAFIITLYIATNLSAISLVEPETTFIIFSTVCTLSPGLILSGEYHKKKSSLYFNPLSFSKIGKQISSVQPG